MEKALEAFMSGGKAQRTLADVIMAKIKDKQGDEVPEGVGMPGIDPKVVEVYTGYENKLTLS